MGLFNPNRRLRLLGLSLHGLGGLAAVTIALLAEFLAYRPLDAQVAAHVRRTEELQVLLREEQQCRREHARLGKDLSVAGEQAEILKKRIPDEPREADFLAQVSELADESGLRIQDYRPGVVTPRHLYSTMRVDLICEGDYESICKFLDGLSALPRHSTMVRLEIDSTIDKKHYSARISLELYVAAPAGPMSRKSR